MLAVWNWPKLVLQTLGRPASRLKTLDRELKVARTSAHFRSQAAHAQAEAQSAKSFLAVWNWPKLVLQTLGRPVSRLKRLDRELKVPRTSAHFRSDAAHNALIQPHFDYCAPVWDGLSSYLCEKLQKLQNRAARVILQANCEINSSLLLETLKWDKLSSRRRKQKAIMMFKSLNGLAPVYLQDLFSERNTDYNLRDAFRKLNLPKPRTDYLKRSFGYSGALLWNSLPENIRAIRSIGQFKKEINRALKTSDSHSAIL